MVSPTLKSLNPSKTTPHSNPAFTSLTSSLNLLSERIAPSNISLSSLLSLTLAFRLISPSVTYDPAIFPTFEALKICLTIAFPIIFYSNTGASIPFIAFSTSSIAL